MATLVHGCMPYKVKMTCGHIETRKMREATAGVPWSEDVVLTACCGCDYCEPSKRPPCQMCRYYSKPGWIINAWQIVPSVAGNIRIDPCHSII